MAKSDNYSSQVPPQTPPPGNPDHKALVTALTDAFNSLRQEAPPPDPLATAAGVQYRSIKGSLRTHSETI
jgi:hypothetical protein